jgi:sec-independent protein translocase protein TatA
VGAIVTMRRSAASRCRDGDVEMLRHGLEPWHVLIVVTVMVLLFGSKRLPDAARSLGQSLRILKSETAKLRTDEASGRQPSPQAAERGTDEPPGR